MFIGDQLWIIVSNSTYLLLVLHGYYMDIIFFSFFKDGMQTINHFNSYITSMIPKLKDLKNRQEGERKQLLELRESLRNSLDSYKEVCFLLRCVYSIPTVYFLTHSDKHPRFTITRLVILEIPQRGIMRYLPYIPEHNVCLSTVTIGV